MPFGADMDHWATAPDARESTGLGLVEKKVQRTYLGLSWPEAKLLIIAGVGFLMDAYDLFVINMIVPLLLLAYYPAGTKHVPWGLDGGVLKAAANIGNIVGQLLFGLLGDVIGRSNVYGKELVIVIVAVILTISAPSTPHLSANSITVWIAWFRFCMGIGIGGDYPMSAAIVSDRARLENRGMLLAIIFSNQGLGNLLGGIAAVAVVAAYKDPVSHGNVHKLDGAWRILQGLSLIPALGVIYHRFTLVESSRYKRARQLQDVPEAEDLTMADVESGKDGKGFVACTPVKQPAPPQSARSEFTEYFSEWRHLRLLIGTCLTWFLVDITFYGISLNQSAILSAIGFTNGTTWGKLMKTATGNLIITSAGFLPGYWITIGLVEVIGRRTIQLIGFAGNTIFFSILAAHYNTLKNHTAPFFACFVFLQLFFNFGANATTFIIPGEVFPTRVRSTAHGLSAACGKLGAIAASLGFAELSKPSSIGTEGVFWIFTGISVLGFIVTFFFTIETKGRDADVIDQAEIQAKTANV
ncbi:hypothetical protein OC835_000256 [Tilletia horrida]|uniref:Major facilitator superfamily (MFS) profile domain-containing protein n=1 Tax=Tilletia horrida TaxID=155126 RepID=A0AAN6GHZ5_9BASI|nr:hypothetical protein OC842_001300 [Tilletia horrida]KAK0541272.1 hypothetical protein OC835_000256 [Tilletia horrida]